MRALKVFMLDHEVRCESCIEFKKALQRVLKSVHSLQSCILNFKWFETLLKFVRFLLTKKLAPCEVVWDKCAKGFLKNNIDEL